MDTTTHAWSLYPSLRMRARGNNCTIIVFQMGADWSHPHMVARELKLQNCIKFLLTKHQCKKNTSNLIYVRIDLIELLYKAACPIFYFT